MQGKGSIPPASNAPASEPSTVAAWISNSGGSGFKSLARLAHHVERSQQRANSVTNACASLRRVIKWECSLLLILPPWLEEWRWRPCVCRRGLLFKPIFCDRNPSEIASMLGHKPEVRQDEELEFHFNKGQFVVENSLARFGPLRLCLWVFLKSRVYINHLRTLQDLKAKIRAEIAHHVTYYRCAPTQLCKRPSTLCLPVTCQPDPAMFHRPRKAPTEIHHYRGQEAAYAINDYVMRTTAVKRTDTRPVDSEGDVNSRLNDLENLLTKFEDEDDVEGEQLEISGVSDISKILKPKVPASVKAKQDKILKLRAVKTNVTETVATTENVNKLEVKEAPEEPLEILLQRLNKENVKRKDEKHDDTNENKEGLQTKPEIGSRHQRQSVYLEQKPPLDDNSALELHKSKSYIVSLIDKALSKELGTVPGDKCSRKEFLSMNPKKAIDLVNRHISPKIYDRTMSLDLTTPASTSKKDEQQCVCKNGKLIIINYK
ncbi:hypothetical protein GEV33_012879 [Tenebrio molitor]|uniref:Uncharacterized protein n=1 Tax=Tenebrio molitor TaxID=7067 RepID=A0A8J6H907_TENMO|nr:hypothetical protein GEV33_012879 [Tenebrio molitor]